jgi:hypothetical protein
VNAILEFLIDRKEAFAALATIFGLLGTAARVLVWRDPRKLARQNLAFERQQLEVAKLRAETLKVMEGLTDKTAVILPPAADVNPVRTSLWTHIKTTAQGAKNPVMNVLVLLAEIVMGVVVATNAIMLLVAPFVVETNVLLTWQTAGIALLWMFGTAMVAGSLQALDEWRIRTWRT